MEKFKNSQKINCIKLKKTVSLYCPMGSDFYVANFDVDLFLGQDSFIPDYIEVDRFFSNLSGQHLIIEDAVCKVLDYFVRELDPMRVEVSLEAQSNVHLPVTVYKSYSKV